MHRQAFHLVETIYKQLANSFVQYMYFEGKVSEIRCSLDAKVVDVASLASFQAQPQVHNYNFSAFAEVSEEDVLQVVKKSATKSCSLDSILTWLVKSNIDVFLSAITKIINTSLQSGQFPGKFKEAIIIHRF